MDPAADTIGLYRRYVVPNYGRVDLRLARGQGCRVWDEEGNGYLDFGAGIAVCSLGHCHPRVTEALARQAQTLIHTSNLYYTRPQGLLARRLVEAAGHPGKIFFCNSGAEANEALFKLARKFGNECEPPAPRHHAGETIEPAPYRYEILSFQQSFHGRTLAGIAATGQEKVKKGFEPAVEGFIQAPFNDAPALRAAITPKTAAVLLEPIQGESGIQPATADFLRAARSLCDELGLLLLFDEVQCGLGRTGDWCGWRSLGATDVLPDGISWAKGIAGGFPMGAIWVRDRPIRLKSGGESSLSDLLGPGSHGTTFGGTPLACAVAEAVLRTIEEEDLLGNAARLGLRAKGAIEALRSPFVKEVRGVGLMIGIELIGDFKQRASRVADDSRSPAGCVIHHLQKAGLLAIPSGTHAIRWLPPLNVTAEEIDEAVDILTKVLAALE